MREKGYYSVRAGKSPTAGKFDLKLMAELIGDLSSRFRRRSYLDRAFGYTDLATFDYVPGITGSRESTFIRKQLRKRINWPPDIYHGTYTEDDVFDVIEIFFDLIWKPVRDGEGLIVAYNKSEAQEEFRSEVNRLLVDYADGYELLQKGEIVQLPTAGMETLLSAKLPETADNNVSSRVEAAKGKFRNRHATSEDRRDAVRDLSDVLEYLRPKVKAVLTRSDESDLFNLANNFGIRHHNEQQKTQYDKPIWLSWMFYYYLATIHASIRLLEKANHRSDLQ